MNRAVTHKQLSKNREESQFNSLGCRAAQLGVRDARFGLAAAPVVDSNAGSEA
jgi:hypothetical protein